MSATVSRRASARPSSVDGDEQDCFAWLVHLYTALGLVCAAGMAVLIVRGGDASFRWALSA